MMRKAALTVRLPGASTAPATRTSTWSQTGAVKNPRKAAISGTKAGGTKPAAAGEGEAERCFVIASVESNRAAPATITPPASPLHFESARAAAGTAGQQSRYQAPWPLMRSSSASSASASPTAPFTPNDRTADTRSIMPRPPSPSLGSAQPAATTALKSSSGLHGSNAGRRQVPSDGRSCHSTKPSPSLLSKQSSGPASELPIQTQPPKCAKSSEEPLLERRPCLQLSLIHI